MVRSRVGGGGFSSSALICRTTVIALLAKTPFHQSEWSRVNFFLFSQCSCNYTRVQVENDNGSWPRALSLQLAVPPHCTKSPLLRVFREAQNKSRRKNKGSEPNVVTSVNFWSKFNEKSWWPRALSAIFFQRSPALTSLVCRFGGVVHYTMHYMLLPFLTCTRL